MTGLYELIHAYEYMQICRDVYGISIRIREDTPSV